MMVSVRQVWRGGRIALFALAGWLAVHGAALAQAPQAPAKAQGGANINSMTYVMAYGVVILGIVLGMLFVCRSSNRRDRAKPEQFAESSLVKKDDE
jgi:hypothetical protein